MAGWSLPRVVTHFRPSQKTCALFYGLGKCSNGAQQRLGTHWSGSNPNPRTRRLCKLQPRSMLSTPPLAQCHGDGQAVLFPFVFLVIALFEATAPGATLSLRLQNAFLDKNGSVGMLRWGGYF